MFIYSLYSKLKVNKEWFLGQRSGKEIVEGGKNIQSTYKNLKHKVDQDFTSHFLSKTERKYYSKVFYVPSGEQKIHTVKSFLPYKLPWKIMYFTYFITHFTLIINIPAYLGNKTHIFHFNIWTGFISIWGNPAKNNYLVSMTKNILFVLQRPDAEPKSSLYKGAIFKKQTDIWFWLYNYFNSSTRCL